MTKPTSKVKDKYNSKAYDSITLRVKKGQKAEIEKQAKQAGFINHDGNGNINGYINDLIRKDNERN